MAEGDIIGVRGTDFLIDAGRGDAFGQVDVPLGRVFSLAARRYEGPAAPVSSIVARGYWEDASAALPSTLDLVRAALPTA